jgi:CheY-like chemotaxis protein
MNKNPIIIIDDDDEDLEIIQDAFRVLELENDIIVFNDGYVFLEYVKTTNVKTFFILCDINMSRIGGLELRQRIYDNEELRLKCVPFVFFSTGSASKAVLQAYSYGVQGYFVKPNSFEAIKEMLLHIVNYWQHSQHPNI